MKSWFHPSSARNCINQFVMRLLVDGNVEAAIALIDVMSKEGITIRVEDINDEQQKVN